MKALEVEAEADSEANRSGCEHNCFRSPGA